MGLYTKTGDGGTTGLLGGGRIDKNSARVEAYGTVDETCALLGVARAAGPPESVDRFLAEIQADLFAIGSELACAPEKEHLVADVRIGDAEVARLESAIDATERALPPPRGFVLPGGTPAAAALQHARAVCRRAERRALATHRDRPLRSEIVVYLNRLSDLLYALALRCNQLCGVEEQGWSRRD